MRYYAIIDPNSTFQLVWHQLPELIMCPPGTKQKMAGDNSTITKATRNKEHTPLAPSQHPCPSSLLLLILAWSFLVHY